ncbi:MAG: anti-sigma factor domain-containing protein [Bacillota bacterium]|jgi:hypothetical protein
MKPEEKGILLEKDGKGIVLTADGEFRYIPSPQAEVGAEVPLPSGPPQRWWLLSLAAALAAVFIGLGLYRYFLPAPVAYVALDINPSLELGIDRQERVVKVVCLNEEARRLAAGVKVRGLPVTKAVTVLLGRAKALEYLDSRRPGVVLVTVVPARKDAPVPVEVKRLAEVAVRQLEKERVPAKVVAATVPAAFREEARRLGLSPGRYALKAGAENVSKPLSVQELKREGLAQLETRRQIQVEKLLQAERRSRVVVIVPPEIELPGKSRTGGGQAMKDIAAPEDEFEPGRPGEGRPLFPQVPVKHGPGEPGDNKVQRDEPGLGEREQPPPEGKAREKAREKKEQTSRNEPEEKTVREQNLKTVRENLWRKTGEHSVGEVYAAEERFSHPLPGRGMFLWKLGRTRS